MSLVENLVQQLTSNNGIGAISKIQNFDINDDTFEKLLEKTMKTNTNEETNKIGQLGVPAGFEIESIDENSNSTNPIKETQQIDFKKTEPFEIKDLKLGDYLSNYLSDMDNYKSPIMNMAIKQASNAYNTFNKGLISDLTDLASDLAKNM